jgi:hypothetical protein
LSVVQGLASRLGLSHDIPNEFNPVADVAIAIVTRMGQDKPGALQDWLGLKNRARAESIVKISWHERQQKLDLA